MLTTALSIRSVDGNLELALCPVTIELRLAAQAAQDFDDACEAQQSSASLPVWRQIKWVLVSVAQFMGHKVADTLRSIPLEAVPDMTCEHSRLQVHTAEGNQIGATSSWRLDRTRLSTSWTIQESSRRPTPRHSPGASRRSNCCMTPIWHSSGPTREEPWRLFEVGPRPHESAPFPTSGEAVVPHSCLEHGSSASTHTAQRYSILVTTSWVFVISHTTLKIMRGGGHRNLWSKKLLYALTLDGLLQSAVPLGSRVSLTYRLVAPVSKTTSAPTTPWQAYHIFMGGGEPAAHGA
jgi:hypothetical protein